MIAIKARIGREMRRIGAWKPNSPTVTKNASEAIPPTKAMIIEAECSSVLGKCIASSNH